MRQPLSMLLVLLCAAMAAAGCSGDAGPAGPAGGNGQDGSPMAIKVLFATTGTESRAKQMMVIAMRDGLFPIGTEMEWVSISLGTPSLDFLKGFDCVLVWTVGNPQDAATLGDRLADYVDGGGGVVMCQFAFSASGPMAGRIMTPGYAPLLVGPSAIILSDRKIDFLSLDFPLHPVFHRTDVFNITYGAQPDFSSPGLDATATAIAMDDQGEYAIAVNATNNVIGLNMFGGWWFADPQYVYASQVIANSCLFVAGAF